MIFQSDDQCFTPIENIQFPAIDVGVNVNLFRPSEGLDAARQLGGFSDQKRLDVALSLKSRTATFFLFMLGRRLFSALRQPWWPPPD